MQFTPQRLEKIHRSMQHEGIDAVVITRPSNIRYVTGYDLPSHEVPAACIVADDARPILIVSEQQTDGVCPESVMAEVMTYSRHEFNDWNFPQGSDFWPRIVEIVRDLGVDRGTLGLERNWLSVREFDSLKSLLPDAGFVDFSKILWRLRQIKDAAEIEAIRQAVRVAEIGIRTGLEIIDIGKSETEMSLEIESVMRGAGGQLRGIRAAVLVGNHGRLPFARPGSARVAADDLVVIDVTVSFAGYFAELARTVHAGHPSADQRSLFEFALNTVDDIEKKLELGAGLGDVATRTLQNARRRGPDYVLSLPLGSSIGLDLREPPFIDPSSTSSVREGCVLSIRPVCFNTAHGTAKIADMFLMSHNRRENLASLSRETL